MHVDPLFVDLRIALDNAEPIRKVLIGHLAEGLTPLSAPQRVLVDAGLAQMVQSVYTAAENLLLKGSVRISVCGGAVRLFHGGGRRLRRTGRRVRTRRHRFASADELFAELEKNRSK